MEKMETIVIIYWGYRNIGCLGIGFMFRVLGEFRLSLFLFQVNSKQGLFEGISGYGAKFCVFPTITGICVSTKTWGNTSFYYGLEGLGFGVKGFGFSKVSTPAARLEGYRRVLK